MRYIFGNCISYKSTCSDAVGLAIVNSQLCEHYAICKMRCKMCECVCVCKSMRLTSQFHRAIEAGLNYWYFELNTPSRQIAIYEIFPPPYIQFPFYYFSSIFFLSANIFHCVYQFSYSTNGKVLGIVHVQCAMHCATLWNVRACVCVWYNCDRMSHIGI